MYPCSYNVRLETYLKKPPLAEEQRDLGVSDDGEQTDNNAPATSTATATAAAKRPARTQNNR
uniref:Uncharacterized protein n=1 Tax=Oryza glumipatula TaxID=40148 RepID=A0A0D9ZCQ1_9ORYZ